MTRSKLDHAILLFASFDEIEGVYLFGSQADGTATEASDFDFGVLTYRNVTAEREAQIKMELLGRLGLALKRDDSDVVMLRSCLSSELRFAVVQDGRLIYTRDSNSDFTDFEIKIKHEYCDHISALRRNGLLPKR